MGQHMFNPWQNRMALNILRNKKITFIREHPLSTNLKFNSLSSPVSMTNKWNDYCIQVATTGLKVVVFLVLPGLFLRNPRSYNANVKEE